MESKAPYLEHGIKRLETLFGIPTEIIDISHYVRDIKVPTHKDLTFFQLNKVLSPDSLFIGFGKPNVYVGIPDGKGGFYKFDAKSLKRADSKIVDTRNFAQSGLIFRIHIEDIEEEHLRETVIQRVLRAAEKESGTRSWTCVNANAKMLEEAGFDFSLSEDMPSKYYFPMPLAKKIMEEGIMFHNQRLKVTVIRTVPLYLERFGLSVVKSQWMTFNRHSQRFISSNAKWLYNIGSKLKSKLIKRNKDDKIEDFVTYKVSSPTRAKKYPITFTYPSKKGTFFRWVWGPHSFFSLKVSNQLVNNYLSETIVEYEAKSGTLFNFIKQNILFNKKVVSFIREHLAKNESDIFMTSESELFNMLRTHTDGKPHKYNIVVKGDQVIVMKLDIKYKFIDWVMSKHILSSGYSNDVRYAGEVWKTQDGKIHLSNDSGTYAPTNEMLESTKEMFEEIFPETIFVTERAY